MGDALTRDAVVGEPPPPTRAALCCGAPAAVEAAHLELWGSWRDVAVDLAAQVR